MNTCKHTVETWDDLSRQWICDTCGERIEPQPPALIEKHVHVPFTGKITSILIDGVVCRVEPPVDVDDDNFIEAVSLAYDRAKPKP